MKFVTVVLFALVALQSASAKVFTRCDLATELLRQGFARATLANCKSFFHQLHLFFYYREFSYQWEYLIVYNIPFLPISFLTLVPYA